MKLSWDLGKKTKPKTKCQGTSTSSLKPSLACDWLKILIYIQVYCIVKQEKNILQPTFQKTDNSQSFEEKSTTPAGITQPVQY